MYADPISPPYPPELLLDVQEEHRSLRGMDPFEHVEGCRRRKAATCAIPIECDHGFDVCPVCDPCTCAEVTRG